MDGPVLIAPDGVERACQQPAPVGLDQGYQLAAGIVASCVRVSGKDEQQTKVGGGGPGQLLAQDRQDLGRPQKLVLQVNEALGGTQPAQVGLEDAEAPSETLRYNPVRPRGHDLQPTHAAGC